MKGDTVTDARVGLGAVAPTVLLVDKAAKALIGSKLDDAALDAAAAACSAACKPIDDKRGTIKYRTKIAGVLLKRAAMIARDRINGIEHHGHAGLRAIKSLNMAKIHVTTTINGAPTEFLCDAEPDPARRRCATSSG